MSTYKNVVCWDLEIGNDLESEHLITWKLYLKI